MPVFVDPSELKSNSLFPDEIDAIPCPGLEETTGADFVISKIPVSPVVFVPSHIKMKSLFCQRKSGYDAIGDFNQIWLEIGRMKALRIPMQQCFILPVGKFYRNGDGLLRIEGKKPLKNTERITYLTYLKNEAEWGYSGVQVRRLNSEDELSLFIQAQTEELKRVEDRSRVKEVFTKGTPFIPDDPFQEVSEVDDWRNLFLNGVKGVGLKTLDNIANHIEDEVQYIQHSGAYALKAICDEDCDGKPLHKVPGIGKGLRKQVRKLLGLHQGFNLHVLECQFMSSYAEGWNAALDAFKTMIEEKDRSPVQVWKQLRNKEIPF